jgi:signal transduction histidine kinase/response regulator RpfG family c-di-GMP phosphodiesterase
MNPPVSLQASAGDASLSSRGPPAQSAAADAAAPAPLPRAKVLVVDDDERNLFAMAKVLEDIADVITAQSGKEALKWLLDGEAAVILLDVLMPGMDGYETASLVRARERTRHVPIIFLTAINKDDAHMLRGYSMGAVDYVFKPVEPVILKSKVAVFVELFNKTRESERKAEQERRLLAENFRVRTEKILAERALRRSEERQAIIINSLPLALYAGEPGQERATPRFISGDVKSLAGFESHDFLETDGFWADRIHPDDRDHVLQAFKRLGESGSLAIEYRWRCADEEYRYFLDQAVLLRDEAGNPKEIVGTLLDVTERRRLEQQLIQAQKLDAIGKLTGGIAHDFNNMLTVVIGSLERLRRTVGDDPAALKRVELALEGAHRCTGLTRQLLSFARRQPLQPRAVDLNDLVASVAGMMRRILGDTVELTVDHGSGLWPVHADPTQVESALINLVVNARDAMPDGGLLSITTRNVDSADVERFGIAGAAPGGYVALIVTDTGVGMSAGVVERIFEPFFTTKEVGRGTGLGLSIIYGFVKQSGGHIAVDSKVGAGTRITLFLPRADAPAPASAAPVEVQAIPRAQPGEVVLVVEDHAAVRQVAAQILLDLGYEVLEAENGPTALDVLAERGRVDLLFTDLAMPGGLTGIDLAAAAAARVAGLPVLLTSAYVDKLAADPLPGARFKVLGKPYREPDLARAVREAIDGP